ncbi:hypothetical protein HBI31_093110 [Parastagonospora nodorum]|nr:hypothetical protein HBI31_093110 [Parastagonospora nodorum]
MGEVFLPFEAEYSRIAGGLQQPCTSHFSVVLPLRPPTRGVSKARRLTYTYLRTPSTLNIVFSSAATADTIPLSRRRGCPATELLNCTARRHLRSFPFYNRALFSAIPAFSAPLGTVRRPKVGRSHNQYLQL